LYFGGECTGRFHVTVLCLSFISGSKTGYGYYMNSRFVICLPLCGLFLIFWCLLLYGRSLPFTYSFDILLLWTFDVSKYICFLTCPLLGYLSFGIRASAVPHRWVERGGDTLSTTFLSIFRLSCDENIGFRQYI